MMLVFAAFQLLLVLACDSAQESESFMLSSLIPFSSVVQPSPTPSTYLPTSRGQTPTTAFEVSGTQHSTASPGDPSQMAPSQATTMAPSQATTMASPMYASTGSYSGSSVYLELEQTLQVSPTAASSCCETSSPFPAITTEGERMGSITATQNTPSAATPTSATPTPPMSVTPTSATPTPPTSVTPTSITPTPPMSTTPTPLTSATPTPPMSATPTRVTQQPTRRTEAPTTQNPDGSVLGRLAMLPVWVWVVVGIGALFLLSCCAICCTMCVCLRKGKSGTDSQRRTSQTSGRTSNAHFVEEGDGEKPTNSTTSTLEALYPTPEALYPTPENSQDVEVNESQSVSGLRKSWSRRSSRCRVSTFKPELSSKEPATGSKQQQQQAEEPRPHSSSPGNNLQTNQTPVSQPGNNKTAPVNPLHYQCPVPKYSPDRSLVPKPAPVNQHYGSPVPKPVLVDQHYNSKSAPVSPHYQTPVPVPPVNQHYKSPVPRPDSHYKSPVPKPPPVNPHYQAGNSHNQTHVTQYYQGLNPIPPTPDYRTMVTNPAYSQHQSPSEYDPQRPILGNNHHHLHHQRPSTSVNHGNQLIIPNPGYQRAFSSPSYNDQAEARPVTNETANSYHNPVFGMQDSQGHHHHNTEMNAGRTFR